MVGRSESDGQRGRRRRSPRISASKQNHQTPNKRRKSKFDDDDAARVSILAKQVWKGRDSPQDAHRVEWRCGPEENQKQDQDDDDDDQITNPLPAKHILELVLDTLQRRDTYEIFAEPVDPDEVEDYYEIIKEPMDFGTMRAKLHEGMYKNVEQFEHDVFLIPKNAMHFNSSTTIYFRQARAIYELAKKVFHALKTDAENFVLEFSGTRRRSMRKALSPVVKSSDVSSKPFRRSSKKRPPISGMVHRCLADEGDHDGRLSSSTCGQVTGRRLTYWARKEYSVCTTEPLLLTRNQGDYKNSLMSFVKDLGPTAQMVARQKLSQIQSNNDKCTFRTFRDFASSPSAGAGLILKQPFSMTEAAAKGNGKKKIDVDKDGVVVVVVKSSNEMAAIPSPSPRDDNVRPVILALENSHSNGAHELKLRNKKSCPWRPAAALALGAKKPPIPVISQFTFDLPFLKARLNQMNDKEGAKCMHACLG